MRADQTFSAILALPTCRFGASITLDARGEEQLDELVFLSPYTPLYSGSSKLASGLSEALQAWLQNPHTRLAFPLARHGTDFQHRIWQAIRAIPCGQTRSYGELSTEHGGTPRAVGQACGANPFPIIVPCHRVLAKSGIGGFANAREGWLLDTKRWLLRHEGALHESPQGQLL